ncbi:AAA family ATPase [Marisediminicola senii]|uniref:AAA family ATPase n=1 Tax=Marisediminicola senii TaxID=2711233 RepID=UPI0013EA7CDD|nr:MoxR family ATPase [Marisediminicola senii]
MTTELRNSFAQVRTEVGKAVVGQDGAVTGLLIALLSGGHVLLEGVPGVAKTLLVRSLSHALSLETTRVQFTPDLMPGDVTGSLVYDSRAGDFEFRKGPVFTNIMLADEINRTPPKTQSALLEAMEERQVSVDGVSRQLPAPFMVAATQNPIEYEGTYTLPEAQLDRFLLKLVLDLPDRATEVEVLRRHAAGFNPRDLAGAGVTPVLSAGQLADAQALVQTVGASPDVVGYAVDLARATRESPSVRLGVSPRGSTALLSAAKSWAWLTGSDGVTPDHIQAMVLPVMRHRIQLRPEAELEGVSADTILRSILQQVQVPI